MAKKTRRLKVGQIAEQQVINLDGDVTKIKSKVIGNGEKPNRIKSKEQQTAEPADKK